MKQRSFKTRAPAVIWSAVLAGELAVLLDVVIVFCGKALSVGKFAVLLTALFLLNLIIPGFDGRKKRKVSALIAVGTCIPLLLCTICWYTVSERVVYRAEDAGKTALYGGHKVMLLVPHQDDDINVLGGVAEEYVKYGSDVYIVFSTNGDYYGLAETRFREALTAAERMGIPEDHVIFLGYGDQWDPAGPHLYNAEPGEVMVSYWGKTETYGTAVHSVYREGRTYTVDHFLEDIEEVILEYRPDTIFCVDYDYNIDHRALSLGFEKVMGGILRQQPDYRPVVMKGYAYNTAWEAEKDFYGENLPSAQNVFAGPYNQTPEVYRWEERIRLPVHAEGLSRSLISAAQNSILSAYGSQGANMYGVRVINSDKVFWQRRTESLTYHAEIEASSGGSAVLNDFMLLECNDLLERGKKPFDGVWIPEAEDTEKAAEITFAEKTDLATVVLYDHPDPEVNVRNARITFDDGTVLETGALDPGGAASAFAVDRKGISSFTVTLLEMEGDAGLTEIEAYSGEPRWKPEYVKIMDEAGNFVYDYWIDPSGVQRFELYDPSGMAPEFNVFCLNRYCSAVRQGDGILVECPAGEFCEVYVTDENGERLDTVYIQNPGRVERGWKMFWLRAEETVMELCDEKRLHERIFICRLASKLPQILDRFI